MGSMLAVCLVVLMVDLTVSLLVVLLVDWTDVVLVFY